MRKQKENNIVLRGKIVSGIGWASRTLPKQFPFFIPFIPELEKFPPATINLEMECGLSFAKADLVIPNVQWDENIIESFEFFQVVLKHRGKTIDAWLYRPLGSIHRLNPCNVEILAPCHIINEPGDDVEVEFVNRKIRPLEFVRIE